MKYFRKPKGNRGFTMLELLIVLGIIILLVGVALPAFNGIVKLADQTHSINGLKSMVGGVGLWAADHSGKIPSPIYPGGHVGEPPAYFDIEVDGGEPGMWLNGVVYATLSIGLDSMANDAEVVLPPSSEKAAAGGHLVGTVFESKVSVKANPSERDWYRHSYAMNSNLKYDEINDLNGSSDPWLTEKDISKYNQPKAMIFIDCIETNVINSGNSDLLIDAAERRYDGKFVLAAFLDGSVRKVTQNEIPIEDPTSSREASEFWLGVDVTR